MYREYWSRGEESRIHFRGPGIHVCFAARVSWVSFGSAKIDRVCIHKSLAHLRQCTGSTDRPLVTDELVEFEKING